MSRHTEAVTATGFNPRPTHAPGATPDIRKALRCTNVSILARRMRRAQPGFYPRIPMLFRFQSSPDACAGRNRATRRRCASRRGFNPRPTHAPGATTACATAPWEATSFNPRPTHAPGATGMRVRLDEGEIGFNPRPTHAPGATDYKAKRAALYAVSILARRMRRAQPHLVLWITPFSSVSILARRMRRAQLRIARLPTHVSEFQSSPDACAGRNDGSPCITVMQRNVSILARRMRRAQLRRTPADAL